jgi:hypothetical protein
MSNCVSNSILLGIEPTADAGPLLRDALTFKVVDVVNRAKQEETAYKAKHKVNDDKAPFGIIDIKHVFRPGRHPGVPKRCSCGASIHLTYYVLPFGYYISAAAVHYIQRHRGEIGLAQMGRLNAFLGMLPGCDWIQNTEPKGESKISSMGKIDENGEHEVCIKCGNCGNKGNRFIKPSKACNSTIQFVEDDKMLLVQKAPVTMDGNVCSWCGKTFFFPKK